MRAPDLGEHKTPGHFRILMLGDSTLAGTKVSNDELYSSLLEKKLNEAAGTPKFEVMNMGVNAWGPAHEYAFVKKFGSFEADLAILCGPIYNCSRPLYGLENLPFFPADHPPRLALEHVAYQLIFEYRQKVQGIPFWGIGQAWENQSQQGLVAWEGMAEFLQQNHAEVMIELLPRAATALGTPVEATDPGPRQFAQLQERVKRLGVYANLMGPVFKGVARAKDVYHDGVHFDRLGHRLYADYLFEELRQHSPRIKEALEHR